MKRVILQVKQGNSNANSISSDLHFYFDAPAFSQEIYAIRILDIYLLSICALMFILCTRFENQVLTS